MRPGWAAQAAGATAIVRQFAAFHKPVLLGETFPIRSSVATERAFLLGVIPYVVGIFEFFDGRDPRHMTVKTTNDAIYRAGLMQFIDLRPAILRPR